MTQPTQGAVRRLFIALMLPADIRQRLAAACAVLDDYRDVLRPVRPEALHVTLRFLGNLDVIQERQAAEACAEAADGVNPFPFVIGGYGAFPNERRPRVIWLGVRDGATELAALQRRVEDGLLSRHIIAAREPFTPHLTLARVRRDAASADGARVGAALAALAALDLLGALPSETQARCTADTINLVHSTLTPHGSCYVVVGSWPLY